MTRWLILPYDGSPLAHAALQHAARHARRGHYGDGVLLAVSDAEPASLDRALADARARTGGDVPLAAHALAPADPTGSLRRLAGDYPDATLVAPVDARVDTESAAAALAAMTGGGRDTALIVYIKPDESCGRAQVAGSEAPDGRATAARDWLAPLRRLARLIAPCP